MSVHRKYMSYYSHCSFFMVTIFWNMDAQKNENSFFTCYYKVVLDRFFERKKKVVLKKIFFKKKVVLEKCFGKKKLS